MVKIKNTDEFLSQSNNFVPHKCILVKAHTRANQIKLSAGF